METVTQRSSYKGHPVLKIFEGDTHGHHVICFGLRKAEAILASLEAIRAFVGRPEPKPEPQPPKTYKTSWGAEWTQEQLDAARTDGYVRKAEPEQGEKLPRIAI